MSAYQEPPWLGKEKSVQQGNRPVGNPVWYPGMKSPNSAGRPKGSTPQTQLMQKMLADADGIVAAMVAKALEGDTGAASLIISRLLPTIKAQAEKVSFNFDSTASIVHQVEEILQAISHGVLAADVGKQIIDAVATLGSIRAVEELEQRIATLEGINVNL